MDNGLKFDEGRIFEDVIFSTKAIFYANKVVSVPNTKYHYIERTGSIVKSKLSEKAIQDRIFAYTQLYEFAKEKNIELPKRLKFYSAYWKNPFIKIYRNKTEQKYMLFGFVPIYTKSINT